MITLNVKTIEIYSNLIIFLLFKILQSAYMNNYSVNTIYMFHNF